MLKSEFTPREALRNGRKVILEMVPEEHRERYIKRREGEQIENRNRAQVPGLDYTIHPDKYYPMFFDFNDTPTILKQGWFHYKIGLEWWQFKLGTTRLEKFHLVKGEEAIDKRYAVKNYFIYKTRKIMVRSKIIFPPEIKYANSRKSFKKKLNRLAGVPGDTRLTEIPYFQTLFRIIGEKFQPGFDRQSIKNHKYKQNEKNRDKR